MFYVRRVLGMDNASRPKIDSYDDAMRWLYDRIDYERTRPNGQSNPFRLERIQAMLELIGSPQNRIPVIHIAGTKGKGSTAAFIESIVRHAGYRTGLYTSPHLELFEERLQVNRRLPDQSRITELIAEIADVLHRHEDFRGARLPTFFEVATLLGWRYFDQEKVDLVVLETGLGGRLDCTNVCSPLVTVITTIGLDHTQILGNTLDKIAYEKAGIIKSGIPVIQGRLPTEAAVVVESRAAELGCSRSVLGEDFFPACIQSGSRTDSVAHTFDFHWSQGSGPSGFDVFFTKLDIPLRGQHQVDNAANAVAACVELRKSGGFRIDQQAIREGLRNVDWPLRFEVVDRGIPVIMDAAHNPDSIAALVSTLNSPEWAIRPRIVVFGSSSDKDVRAMLSLLNGEADHLVFTRYTTNPRSVGPDVLSTVFADVQRNSTSLSSGSGAQVSGYTRVLVAESPREAVQSAMAIAGGQGVVVVTGSLFLAAEARSLLTTGQV